MAGTSFRPAHNGSVFVLFIFVSFLCLFSLLAFSLFSLQCARFVGAKRFELEEEVGTELVQDLLQKEKGVLGHCLHEAGIGDRDDLHIPPMVFIVFLCLRVRIVCGYNADTVRIKCG